MKQERDRWGRTERDRALIQHQAPKILAYRKLYKAAKALGPEAVRLWIELVTYKLNYIHVSQLREDQSHLLYKAARERDRLLAYTSKKPGT